MLLLFWGDFTDNLVIYKNDMNTELPKYFKNLEINKISKADIRKIKIKIIQYQNFLEKIEKAENRDEALELVEEYITKLNELNEKCDYEIFETDQREFIWEIFNEAMNLKWFSSPEDEDVTEEWREF